MTTKKPRILWISGNPVNSLSFAQQSSTICYELIRRGYDVHYLASAFSSFPKIIHNIKVYPLARMESDYGNAEIVNEYCNRIHPDLVISLTNSHHLAFLLRNQRFMAHYPWIHWNPTDAKECFMGINQDNEKIPYYVSIANFEYEERKKWMKNMAGVIHHATNASLFKPLPEEKRREIRNRFHIPEKSFVIGTVINGEVRKQPFRLVEAFKLFAKKHPDAIFAPFIDLRTGRDLQQHFFDIDYYIKNYCKGFEAQIIPLHRLTSRPISEHGMNEVYNTFNLFATATAGEGWGIPLVETMCCEVPPVATDCSSIPEILGEDCGWKVKVKDWVWGLYSTVSKGALVDIEEMAKQFEDAYQHPEKRKQFGKNGREKAIRTYNINRITTQWEELILKVFEESKERYPAIWQNGQPNSRKNPQTLEQISRWILKYYQHPNMAKAFIELTDEEKEDPKILYLRAKKLIELGDYYNAMKTLENLYNVDPKNKKGENLFKRVHSRVQKIQW